MDRRDFLKITGSLALASLTGRTATATAAPAGRNELGCLVDTTLCVGCRKCELACNQRQGLARPKESFDELTVLENARRPDETSYTVVNKYYPKHIGSLTWRHRPTYVKFQCMHCSDPSCVSACIVGGRRSRGFRQAAASGRRTDHPVHGRCARGAYHQPPERQCLERHV